MGLEAPVLASIIEAGGQAAGGALAGGGSTGRSHSYSGANNPQGLLDEIMATLRGAYASQAGVVNDGSTLRSSTLAQDVPGLSGHDQATEDRSQLSSIPRRIPIPATTDVAMQRDQALQMPDPSVGPRRKPHGVGVGGSRDKGQMQAAGTLLRYALQPAA